MSNGKSRIGLVGLAVMGQNLALNIADKGFDISVYNRSPSKVDDTVQRAEAEGLSERLSGYKDLSEFVQSIQKPRTVILLIKAGKPVDMAIEQLQDLLEEGDLIVDGGNEQYTNTERRAKQVAAKGLLYMGMGVSGGEEGARNGPSLMPGGTAEAYGRIEDILVKIAAQSDTGPCVTHIGEGGAGNYVKTIHNAVEYGDMQLIAESYDLLKSVGGLTNDELAKVFSDWNDGELQSFLIAITAQIFRKKDEDGKSYVVDAVLDRAMSKGTGKWGVQDAAERAVPAPTIAAALDARYMSALLGERKAAAGVLAGPAAAQAEDREALVEDLRQALYAAKLCSYAQGMSLIRQAGEQQGWALNLGEIARIWKAGCIIQARFLDDITKAYGRNPELANLLVDPEFAAVMNERQAALRRVLAQGIQNGIPLPAFSASLAYYDSYRRARLPANLVQSQRDLFGAHTYERTDRPGTFHTQWAE